jgi:hypothetical protein
MPRLRRWYVAEICGIRLDRSWLVAVQKFKGDGRTFVAEYAWMANGYV